jgi:PTS system mannitol-specific IIA component/PTS system ascorbate-specific IIA component
MIRFLERPMIVLQSAAGEAEEAIRESGRLLERAGAVRPSYTEAMVEAYRRLGPYFVVAPHIALPHARPEDGVVQAAVSLVQLREPVRFGHAANDPVRLVFGIAAASSPQHIELVRRLSALLADETRQKQLMEVKDVESVHRWIREGSAP